MHRAIIITVAGTSSRFKKKLNQDVLKSIYHDKSSSDTLLSRQCRLWSDGDFERKILVGGYLFNQLDQYVKTMLPDAGLELVYNQHFSELGTCYSFIKGLESLSGDLPDEIVLMEGDIITDNPSFANLVIAKEDVVTYVNDLIRADKSVVFYTDVDRKLRYIYDNKHELLSIPERFSLLGNSGQIWKFSNSQRLLDLSSNLNPKLYSKTNLLLIEEYLNDRPLGNILFLPLKDWFNCNTIDDFHDIQEYWRINDAKNQ